MRVDLGGRRGVPTEFVMVPVPVDRVQEVYRLLAGLPATESARPTEAREEEWPIELIARAYRESAPTMKRFLDHLAGAPGAMLTSAALAAAVGYSTRQQAGMLGAFGNRVKQRYGRATWFFDAQRDPKDGTFVYSMGARSAKVIKKAESDRHGE